MSNTHPRVTDALSLTRCLALALCLCALAPAQGRAQKHDGAGPSKSRAAQDTAAHYSCPMHPDVKSSAAGRCPKCGMALRTASKAPAAEPEAAPAAAMNIPDVELLDQDGKKVRFYSDLVKGKTVAVNFIFTTCTTVCPPLGATFARLQKELGGRVGRDVQLISISVDPVTDTPERMKAWGEKFKAGPGWTLVTGEKAAVDSLLRALAASSPRREDHTPAVLIGNDARGNWRRDYGLARPSELVRLIDEAAEGRPAPAVK
ncbi:MAG TPA: SCO family protein [Pyrinomonadaceae bacterium]|nr:SCO family protein [Pyrinomonadaceae bacterium]